MNNHPSHYSPASLDFIQSSSLFNDASSPSVSNLLSNQSFVGSYEAEANPHFVSLLSFPTIHTPSQQNETTCYRFASSMCSSAREEQPASWPAPPFPDNLAFTSIQPSLIFPRSSDDGQPHNSPVYPPHLPHLSPMGEPFRAPERNGTQSHIPQSTRCSWDGKCDMLLEDLSPSGIARHLKVHHFADSWDDRRRGTCRWHGSPCTGGRPIFYASYGKHIAAVHLGTSSRQCPRCGRAFVRPDTLDRHMKRYCHAPTPEASSESCGL